MGNSAARLMEMVQVAVGRLRVVLFEQLKIEISGRHAEGASRDSLFVENDSTGMGLLVFGLTTKSRHAIEVLRIAVDYPLPLQLLDPKKMGFFETSASGDDDFPFRVFSEHRFQVRSALKHVFALIAQFPPDHSELPVCVSISARVIRVSADGLESAGTTQHLRKFVRVALSNDRLSTIPLPPDHFLTTIQPFLIQGGLTASEYGIHRAVIGRPES